MEGIARESGLIELKHSNDDLTDVMARINRMRLIGDAHDSVLSTEDGGSFPVHRLILISASDYFRALFTSTLNKDDRTHIRVPGVTGDCLSKVLDFAYAQPLQLKVEEIWELLVAADMLLYRPLMSKCCQYLTAQMSPSNCLQFYQHTRIHSMKKFKEAALLYVVSNFHHIIEDDKALMDVSADTLAEILKEDRLTCKEDVLWYLVKKWLEICPDRRAFAAQLLGCLRLAFLDSRFIFESIMCHPIILNDEPCRKVIDQRQDLMWKLAGMFSSPIGDTPYIVRPRMPKDIMFSIGGCDKKSQQTVGVIEVYDSKADIWTQIDKDQEIMDAKRESHCCVFLNNCIYVLGGEDRSTGQLQNFSSCWDLVKKKWYCIPSMKQPRNKFCAVVVAGTIIVVGGCEANIRTLASAEQYHPKCNTWTFIGSMHAKRCSMAAAVVDDKLFVCGGSTNRVDQLKFVELYDVETCAWRSVQHMSEARRGAAAASYRGSILVAGGRNNSSVEKYDLEADIWIRIGNMLEPRFCFSLVVLDDVLHAIGGYYSTERGSLSMTSEAYHEETNSWRSVNHSDELIAHRGICVVHSIPDVSYYLHPNRENLLQVKGKQMEDYREAGEREKAKRVLRRFV